MIPVRVRHKISRRSLGNTAFHLKDYVAASAVANWIGATLQCQGVPLSDAEVRIGGEPWKTINRKEKSNE